MKLFLENPMKAFERDQLLDSIWEKITSEIEK